MKTIGLAAGVALALCVTAAQAQTAAPKREESNVLVFRTGPDGKLDANGDGQVTRDEFLAPVAKAFAEADKNGDGRLSDAERKEGGPALFFGGHDGEGGNRDIRIVRRGPGDAKMDADGDGRVTFEEFATPIRGAGVEQSAGLQAAMRAAFDKADKNRDGVLDAQERKEPIRITHRESK